MFIYTDLDLLFYLRLLQNWNGGHDFLSGHGSAKAFFDVRIFLGRTYICVRPISCASSFVTLPIRTRHFYTNDWLTESRFLCMGTIQLVL
jgi:hypothetical protein